MVFVNNNRTSLFLICVICGFHYFFHKNPDQQILIYETNKIRNLARGG